MRPSRHVRAAVALSGLIGLLGVLLAPTAAGAHGLGGLEPTNYETRVVRVTPPVAGLEVHVLDLGESLELANHTGRVLHVVRRGRVVVDIPPGTQVQIHDHATHRHDEDPTPAAVRRDPGAEHVVRRWTIELRRADMTVEVIGELRWVPGPSPLPWLALAAAAAAVVLLAASGSGARRRVALTAALGTLVGVQAIHLVGGWGASAEPAGERLVASVYSLGGITLAIAAIAALTRRGVGAAAPLVLLAGLALALASGLADVTSLTRSQLPFTGAASVDRLTIALTLGLGAAVAIAGVRALATTTGRGAPRLPDGGDEDAIPAGLRARYQSPD